MVEIADVFIRHGAAYRAKFAQRIPSHHLKAMKAIEQCRTKALGGHVYQCTDCGRLEYRYHSCKNRHCPKCQNKETGQWLAVQEELLLPVSYFLITFTLPEELRNLARAHQKLLYGIFFRASAHALKQLAADPRHLGGTIGMVGILHTWKRDSNFHPHIHFIVPAGALSSDRAAWLKPRYRDWLLPVKALSKLFRGKFRAMLNKAGLAHELPRRVWKKRWNLHCKTAGTGREVLKYLAPYVYRVAMTNRRIKALHDGKVTYTVKDSRGRLRKQTVEAEQFLRRFLQHVLPKGFQKVRYYGFFSSACRELLERVRDILGSIPVEQKEVSEDIELSENSSPGSGSPSHPTDRCRKCGGALRLYCKLEPFARSPPSAVAV